MKILITGNMGYIGPSVIYRLRASYPSATLFGLDSGFFAHCLTNAGKLPECDMDIQHFMDIRKVTPQMLEGITAVVHLAAMSNDPMGSRFEDLTLEINHRATVDFATKAKQAGVKTFVFASSCSIYGYAEGGPRTESAEVNPLTAYARSKVEAEKSLASLADDKFVVTALRFATACGMSERLRLDLVLNDFVASAVGSKRIRVLSDGSPWRPLINIKDMARAIDWAVQRTANHGGKFLAINAGSNDWNYQVKELAEAVAVALPGVDVEINASAPPDKRSYRVNFDLYRELAPNFQPQVSLSTTIEELADGLRMMQFRNENFRESQFMRLKVLTHLQEQRLLSDRLEWSRAA